MIELRHPDGDRLREDYVITWFKNKLKRIDTYFELGDQERTEKEAEELLYAIRYGRIPED